VSGIEPLTVVFFVMGTSLVLLVYLLLTGRRTRVQARLEEMAEDPAGLTPSGPAGPALARESLEEMARAALPRMGEVLLPSSDEDRSRLQARLIRAGFYGPRALKVFLGVKLSLMLGFLLAGLAAGLTGLVRLEVGLIFGGLLGTLGLIAPSFWLDRRKAERQGHFRRALPDALDVLVICLEGGSSLPAGMRRVAAELGTAHPVLAGELAIVLREVQLGRSVGEAVREMAERADLEELRSLASVIIQSERFGASLVKSLRIHSENLRYKRLQRAEEMAQKAVVKLLIPTILFIFPAMFVVVLGPPAMQIVKMFQSTSMPAGKGLP
jgi:tight adherence protein C